MLYGLQLLKQKRQSTKLTVRQEYILISSETTDNTFYAAKSHFKAKQPNKHYQHASFFFLSRLGIALIHSMGSTRLIL